MAKVRDGKNEVEGRSVITEAQAGARQHWDETRSDTVRIQRAQAREQVRASRNPQEQLALLDKHGQRATKERARLLALAGQK